MWSREGGGESVRKWELQSSPIIWETSERCAYPSHARICTKKFGSYVHENMNAVSFKYKPVIHYRTLKTCPSTKFYIRERHPKIAEQLCPSANLYLWETFYSYVPDLLPVNRITGKLFLQIFFSNTYYSGILLPPPRTSEMWWCHQIQNALTFLSIWCLSCSAVNKMWVRGFADCCFLFSVYNLLRNLTFSELFCIEWITEKQSTILENHLNPFKMKLGIFSNFTVLFFLTPGFV